MEYSKEVLEEAERIVKERQNTKIKKLRDKLQKDLPEFLENINQLEILQEINKLLEKHTKDNICKDGKHEYLYDLIEEKHSRTCQKCGYERKSYNKPYRNKGFCGGFSGRTR